jgi:hypothetical protein
MKISTAVATLFLMTSTVHADVLDGMATEVAATQISQDIAPEAPAKRTRNDIDIAKVDQDVKDALSGTMLFLLMLAELGS